ncbi:hypothetical protein MH117_13010 [Paenibacillus sp. ACRRX]|uniref:hypothetical protein n=1 Tax=Paenibacillus sp. ACRRX TaxID=2918206 RepID=UPI001EF49DF0|nr:hypothetical protein [Paenibacillus sp. ACRRX]MCG7408345.1 hypothetical protein [Paenibacillus sp. ACRRX]
MQKVIIPEEVSRNLRKDMERVWDIGQPYWYPLFDCSREDLIAFDSEYIESEEKLNDIIAMLTHHGVEQVIEFLETGETFNIQVSNLYPYYCYNGDLSGGEGFWTSQSMDWIIYASHEGTITFGGEWLVNKIKSLWTDWRSSIEWDTKNQ